MPAVLLILGGVHARIVRYGDHHSPVDAGVGSRIQRIRRHIQPHMLHAAEASGTGNGCAQGNLHGNLFIGRPFRIDLVVFSNLFRNFRGGCAGIA